MAPVRPRKRKSEMSPSASPERSPIKKRKLGVTLAQKQALIDNLQLEIAERARRLRAQYNIQAQQLRSRVEMRVNRIPTTLRRLKMSELPIKSSRSLQSRPAPRSQYVIKPPPVPAKDGTSPKHIPRKPLPTASPTRGQKRLSTEITGSDKENQGEAPDNQKKKVRGGATHAKAPITAAQILSPTSSNTRVLPRDRPASPTKSMISRPASPVKAPTTKASSNILSSIVERAKATRPAAATRKTTTSSTASSNPAAATTSRTRKAAAPPPSTATTRGKRKVSVTSESSEGSTATVVKKTTTTKVTKAPAAKRTVMNTIKSATTKKAPAAKAAPAAPTTGRTLRKRA